MLKSLETEELVSISQNHITVTQIGRLLIRKMPVIFNMHTIKQGVCQLNKKDSRGSKMLPTFVPKRAVRPAALKYKINLHIWDVVQFTLYFPD